MAIKVPAGMKNGSMKAQMSSQPKQLRTTVSGEKTMQRDVRVKNTGTPSMPGGMKKSAQ